MSLASTEGGINIRLKRLRKFRNKNWIFFISVQAIIIFYTFAFTFINTLGYTNAYFNDREGKNGTIHAGTWEVTPPPDEVWDKSSLVFTGVVSNQEQTVSASIKNNGNDMAGTVPYEVWWAEKGNPKEGIKIGDGTAPALRSGETINLNFNTDKPGNYMFKAYQRPNHGDPNDKKENKDNGNTENALWSEQITITASNPDMQPITEKGNEQKAQSVNNGSPVNEQKSEGITQPADSEAKQSTEPTQ